MTVTGRPFLRRRSIRLAVALLLVGSARAQPAGTTVAPAAFTDAEKERFLLEGEIGRRRSAPQGVTATERVMISLDGVEHEAHVQTIDVHKAHVKLSSGNEVDFRDSWRGNVAAYRLDRLLGLGMVPVTVGRRDRQEPASFTWWVDDVLVDEKARQRQKLRAPDPEAWNRQMRAVRIFDQLVYNFDRNAGNLVIDRDWRIWMIDHSRAFKRFKELPSRKNLGRRCPRTLLAALRRLDKPTLESTMDDLLDGYQIDGVLGRRDLIVRHFEDAIAHAGEAAVLYDLPPRGATGAAR